MSFFIQDCGFSNCEDAKRDCVAVGGTQKGLSLCYLLRAQKHLVPQKLFILMKNWVMFRVPRMTQKCCNL